MKSVNQWVLILGLALFAGPAQADKDHEFGPEQMRPAPPAPFERAAPRPRGPVNGQGVQPQPEELPVALEIQFRRFLSDWFRRDPKGFREEFEKIGKDYPVKRKTYPPRIQLQLDFQLEYAEHLMGIPPRVMNKEMAPAPKALPQAEKPPEAL